MDNTNEDYEFKKNVAYIEYKKFGEKVKDIDL